MTVRVLKIKVCRIWPKAYSRTVLVMIAFISIQERPKIEYGFNSRWNKQKQ